MPYLKEQDKALKDTLFLINFKAFKSLKQSLKTVICHNEGMGSEKYKKVSHII